MNDFIHKKKTKKKKKFIHKKKTKQKKNKLNITLH